MEKTIIMLLEEVS